MATVMTVQERRKAERLARKLGAHLGIGLAVHGHHGTAHGGGCGTYDLRLNVEAKRVDCGACGATDLVRTGKG